MVVGLVGQAVAWGLMGMLPGSLLLFAGLVHPPAPPSSPATWVLYTEELCVQHMQPPDIARVIRNRNLSPRAAQVFVRYTSCMIWVVMCDTVTVETMNKSTPRDSFAMAGIEQCDQLGVLCRYETGRDKGKLQSDCSMYQTVGTLIGGLLGGWMLEYWPRFSYQVPLSLPFAPTDQALL